MKIERRYMVFDNGDSPPFLQTLERTFAHPWDLPDYKHAFLTETITRPSQVSPGQTETVEGLVVEVYDIDVTMGVPEGVKPSRTEVATRLDVNAWTDYDRSRRAFRTVLPDDPELRLVSESSIPDESGWVEVDEVTFNRLRDEIEGYHEEIENGRKAFVQQYSEWLAAVAATVEERRINVRKRFLSGEKFEEGDDIDILFGETPESYLKGAPVFEPAAWKNPRWWNPGKQ